MNKTITLLNEDKDKLEMENSLLLMRVTTVEKEKTRILKDKELSETRYRVL